MGVDYYSMLVLGTRVRICDVYELTTTYTNNCYCEIPSSIDIFCSECGKKGETANYTTRNRLFPDTPDKDLHCWSEEGDIELFANNCEEGIVNTRKGLLWQDLVYIGKEVGKKGDSNCGRVSNKAMDIEEFYLFSKQYKEKLKALLLPFDLWREKDYKLYYYLYVSY